MKYMLLCCFINSLHIFCNANQPQNVFIWHNKKSRNKIMDSIPREYVYILNALLVALYKKHVFCQY